LDLSIGIDENNTLLLKFLFGGRGKLFLGQSIMRGKLFLGQSIGIDEYILASNCRSHSFGRFVANCGRHRFGRLVGVIRGKFALQACAALKPTEPKSEIPILYL